jgi:steroid delta-isomerase-like uncharacterized protein
MSLQDNKAVIRRLYDAFSTGDLKVMDEAFAANVVDLFPLEGQAPGVEGFKERLIGLRKSFPDLSFTIETVIAEGNMVAERATLRGTHLGKFMGVPATGKQVTGNMMGFNKFVDSKIVERGRIINVLGMMRQIQSSR